MYIDTHCHLYDEIITEKRENIVREYEKFQVKKVIEMGCNLLTSLEGQSDSKKFNSVYFGAGYHPSDAKDFTNENATEIEKLLKDKKCVCVGEIGLDYHYDTNDKDKQIECFIYQLEMAYKYKLPVSIHSRDATLDTLNILKERKNKLSYSGVIHCFSGSKETAKEYLNLGLYLGFGGTSTFKNARNVLEVLEIVPMEKCLTETDSPYLAPVPFRGEINTPKNIPIIAQKVCEIKGIDFEMGCEILCQNAHNLFTKLN